MIGQQFAKGGNIGVRCFRAWIGDALQDDPLAVTLRGIPAVEGVGIVRHAEGEPLVVFFDFENHRRGKAAQDRGHGFDRDAGKAECSFGGVEYQYFRGNRFGPLEFEPQG